RRWTSCPRRFSSRPRMPTEVSFENDLTRRTFIASAARRNRRMLAGNSRHGMGWQGKKVLVTGAGGFIGSHLTERLVELGAETRALVRYHSMNRWGWLEESPALRHVQVIPGDVRDSDVLDAATEDVEVVFHLAALIAIPYSYRAPEAYVKTNVEGTMNV